MSEFTTTPNLGLFKPNFNGDDGLWATHLNSNADKLDQVITTQGVGPFLPVAGGTVTGGLTVLGPVTVSGKLNISNIPLAKPDGSPPAGAVKGDFYNNGGFVCIAP